VTWSVSFLIFDWIDTTTFASHYQDNHNSYNCLLIRPTGPLKSQNASTSPYERQYQCVYPFPPPLEPATNAVLDCEEVMNALDECHARGFLWKAMGACNGAKTAVNKCLRAERLDRTKENRDKARAAKEKREAVWAEIDANS